MDEPNWTRQNSDVLVWRMPGEETVIPDTPEKKPTLKAATGLLIIISALLTGSVFGLLMMSAVPEKTETKAAPAMNSSAEQQITPAMNSSTEQKATPVEKTVPLFVIQGGLFSTEEAAYKAASSSGAPAAVIPAQNQYSMIYGVFLTKEAADEAELSLESSGTAAYVKETKVNLSSEEEETMKKAADSQQLDEMVSILSP